MRITKLLLRTCLLLACFCGAAGIMVADSQEATAQVHYRHNSYAPPGAIGKDQILQGGARAGYYQPVELLVPDGAKVGILEGGTFEPAAPGRLKTGLLLGEVYRFKVTDIAVQPGEEVYPTVEVVNRLYPPPGSEAKFPIPIQITKEELALAISGRYVTRVIYLENPETALPVKQGPDDQRYFEVLPHDDPLKVADRLGRPMAILRMGQRIPSEEMLLREESPFLRFQKVPRDEAAAFRMGLPVEAPMQQPQPMPQIQPAMPPVAPMPAAPIPGDFQSPPGAGLRNYDRIATPPGNPYR